jgi:hypothetical protein
LDFDRISPNGEEAVHPELVEGLAHIQNGKEAVRPEPVEGLVRVQSRQRKTGRRV